MAETLDLDIIARVLGTPEIRNLSAAMRELSDTASRVAKSDVGKMARGLKEIKEQAGVIPKGFRDIEEEVRKLETTGTSITGLNKLADNLDRVSSLTTGKMQASMRALGSSLRQLASQHLAQVNNAFSGAQDSIRKTVGEMATLTRGVQLDTYKKISEHILGTTQAAQAALTSGNIDRFVQEMRKLQLVPVQMGKALSRVPLGSAAAHASLEKLAAGIEQLAIKMIQLATSSPKLDAGLRSNISNLLATAQAARETAMAISMAQQPVLRGAERKIRFAVEKTTSFQMPQLGRSDEANKALMAVSSAAQGMLLGLSMLRGSIMGTAFNLIFLNFTVLKISLSIAALTALVAGLTMSLNKLARAGAEVANLRINLANMTSSIHEANFTIGVWNKMTTQMGFSSEDAARGLKLLWRNALLYPGLLETIADTAAALGVSFEEAAQDVIQAVGLKKGSYEEMYRLGVKNITLTEKQFELMDRKARLEYLMDRLNEQYAGANNRRLNQTSDIFQLIGNRISYIARTLGEPIFNMAVLPIARAIGRFFWDVMRLVQGFVLWARTSEEFQSAWRDLVSAVGEARPELRGLRGFLLDVVSTILKLSIPAMHFLANAIRVVIYLFRQLGRALSFVSPFFKIVWDAVRILGAILKDMGHTIIDLVSKGAIIDFWGALARGLVFVEKIQRAFSEFIRSVRELGEEILSKREKIITAIDELQKAAEREIRLRFKPLIDAIENIKLDKEQLDKLFDKALEDAKNQLNEIVKNKLRLQGPTVTVPVRVLTELDTPEVTSPGIKILPRLETIQIPAEDMRRMINETIEDMKTKFGEIKNELRARYPEGVPLDVEIRPKIDFEGDLIKRIRAYLGDEIKARSKIFIDIEPATEEFINKTIERYRNSVRDLIARIEEKAANEIFDIKSKIRARLELAGLALTNQDINKIIEEMFKNIDIDESKIKVSSSVMEKIGAVMEKIGRFYGSLLAPHNLIKGLFFSIGVGLADLAIPSIAKMVGESLQLSEEDTKGFEQMMQDMLTGVLATAAVSMVAGPIGPLATVAVAIVAALASTLLFAFKKFTGADVQKYFGPAIRDFVEAFFKAILLPFALLLKPFGIKIADELWDSILKNLREGAAGIMISIYELFRGIFIAVFKALSAPFGNTPVIGDFIKNVLERLESAKPPEVSKFKFPLGDAFEREAEYMRRHKAEREALLRDINKLYEDANSQIAQNQEQIGTSLGGMYRDIAETARDAVEQTEADYAAMIGRMGEASQWFSGAESIGDQIGAGIWTGLERGYLESMEGAVSTITSATQGVVDAVKDTYEGKTGFDIESPSKYMIALGQNIMEGFKIGTDPTLLSEHIANFATYFATTLRDNLIAQLSAIDINLGWFRLSGNTITINIPPIVMRIERHVVTTYSSRGGGGGGGSGSSIDFGPVPSAPQTTTEEPTPPPTRTFMPVIFAQHGGIFTRPTLAVIGEAGPEAVIPLKRGYGNINIYLEYHGSGSRSDASAMAEIAADVVMKRLRSIL